MCYAIQLRPWRSFRKFIRQQVASGRYANASEMIREALLVLENRERLQNIELEEYCAKIREGMASESKPAEAVFSRLEAKYQGMLDQN